MPKVRWGVTGQAVDAEEPQKRERFAPYDGPIPPRYTILDMAVKRIKAKEFSTGNYGFEVLLIATGEGSKNAKKYKGMPVFDNVVVTEANSWKIRQWCDAIGASGKDWDNTVTDAEKNVTKFGRVAVDDLVVRISTAVGSNQGGDPRAEVGDYVSLAEIEEDGDGSSDDGDGDDGETTGNTPF